MTLSHPDTTFSWPQLLPVGTDEFIMKYYSDFGTFPAITRRIRAQKFNSGGSGVWSSPTVVSNAGGISAWTQVLPLISDGSDGFYIAWHDDRDNNQLASTWVNHVSNAGTVLFAPNGVEASTLSGRNHYYPQLALPPGSSNVFVFWNEMDGNQNNRGIYGQKITSTGTKLWATSGMVFIEISPTDVIPEAARHSPADVVVFYSEQVDGLDYRLKAFRVDTDGGYLWSPSIKTICSVVSEKVHVETNNFSNNQWIQTWEDDRNGQKDIYAQNIQLDGSLGPYNPQEGTIEGMVTLVGGSASVTQVTVSAGDVNTHPDETGFYSMVVTQGSYQVIGGLTGYVSDTVNNVVVVTGQTTEDVDLVLNALPTGYITGNVTLSDGLGDVTETEVRAGYHVVFPDEQGNYLMEIEIGTYEVSAHLAGYVADTLIDIVVLQGMTTVGVDFILDPVPTTGFISGIVLLSGGPGDVTEVDVTAGTVTVHPDPDGTYELEIEAGTYDVTANLEGYLTGVVEDVVVVVEQTTPDVDFYLYEAGSTGFIQGYVTLVNGFGDVTAATVTAGGQTVNPSMTGYYFIGLSAGTYDVTADHPYTDPETVNGVTVIAGQNTEDVNFELEINRRDLVIFALDQYNNPIHNIDVEITGPEGVLSGTIVQDVLVFSNQPDGFYEGYAYMEENDPEYTSDTLDLMDQDLVFYFLNVGIRENPDNQFGLSVSPNPANGKTSVTFTLHIASEAALEIYSQQGILIRELFEGKLNAGKKEFVWDGNDNSGQKARPGAYIVVLRASGARETKLVIVN
jgi:hypothetical protein